MQVTSVTFFSIVIYFVEAFRIVSVRLFISK